MTTGEIPKSFKEGIIVPIHKGESKSDPKNYRTVTLTSHLIKVFERIIAKELVAFLETHNLHNKNEYRFRSQVGPVSPNSWSTTRE